MQIYKDGFGKEHEETRIDVAESQEQGSENAGYAEGLAPEGMRPDEENGANGNVRVVNGVPYPANPYNA